MHRFRSKHTVLWTFLVCLLILSLAGNAPAGLTSGCLLKTSCCCSMMTMGEASHPGPVLNAPACMDCCPTATDRTCDIGGLPFPPVTGQPMLLPGEDAPQPVHATAAVLISHGTDSALNVGCFSRPAETRRAGPPIYLINSTLLY